MPKDISDVKDFFARECVPRYVEGHGVWGEASEHHAVEWWLDQAIQETADNLFYLRQVQLRLAPQEGRLRVYIAGPYRSLGGNRHEVVEHILTARDAMAALLRMGHTPFCPHTMTAHFEVEYPDLADDDYLRVGLEWLRLCHSVLVLPGWEHSAGTLAEIAEAERLRLPVWYSMDEVPRIAAMA